MILDPLMCDVKVLSPKCKEVFFLAAQSVILCWKHPKFSTVKDPFCHVFPMRRGTKAKYDEQNTTPFWLAPHNMPYTPSPTTPPTHPSPTHTPVVPHTKVWRLHFMPCVFPKENGVWIWDLADTTKHAPPVPSAPATLPPVFPSHPYLFARLGGLFSKSPFA